MSYLTYGQDRGLDGGQNDEKIFRTIICTADTKNKENVFYASILGIDKYEFYQDSKSYNESYHAKPKNNDADPLGGQIIDLSISHNLVINHYDKSPFKIISNYSSIDTSEINKYLNTYKDYRNKTKIWTQIVYKCNNVKYIKRFRPKVIRILFNQNCIFVSNPIIFNQNKLAIIKVARIRFSSNIKEDDTKIYFVENIDSVWTVKDTFSVTNTTPLTITGH
jgi:hypothetical protein